MKLFAKLFSIVILTLLLVSPVYATTNRTPKNIVLPKNEIVKTDYFATGDTVTISGTVEGDAYIAGGTVMVDGTIKGDLFVAGGTVSIYGPILHDVRAMGGTITIQAPISGNVTVAGGTVTFEKEATVKGSVLAGAGTLNLSSIVEKSIRAGAGSMTVNNQVNGDLLAGVGTLTLLPDAKIKGNLTYWSEQEFVTSGNATVSGAIVRQEPPQQYKDRDQYQNIARTGMKKFAGAMAGLTLVSHMLWGLLLFGIGMLLFRATPVFTQKTIQGVTQSPWNKFLTGLMIVIVVPIVGVLLLITVVGIPVAISVFFGLGIVTVVTHIYSSLFVGTKIVEYFHSTNRTLAYFIGLVSMFMLTFIPVIGGLAKGILGLIVLGAIIKEKNVAYMLMRKHKIV